MFAQIFLIEFESDNKAGQLITVILFFNQLLTNFHHELANYYVINIFGQVDLMT